MTADTITNRTLTALGHTLTLVGGVHTIEAAPARAGKHGEVSESDWTIVATALADSDTNSRDWCQAGEGLSIIDEALAIRKARAA